MIDLSCECGEMKWWVYGYEKEKQRLLFVCTACGHSLEKRLLPKKKEADNE
jgi:hypothetical protein